MLAAGEGDGRVVSRRRLEHRIPRGVDNPLAVAIERGELYVELYRPEGEDRQAPHERDECYFVVEGSGTFVLGNERIPFEAGDCIFVPAGVTHRFEDFGDHVLVWVVFYGPSGGDRR